MTTPRRPHTHPGGGTRRHRLTGPTHLRGVASVEAHARRVLRDLAALRADRRHEGDE